MNDSSFHLPFLSQYCLSLTIKPIVTHIGVHSTQRSESTHNAIKKHTTTTMLLTGLSNTLVEYAVDVDGAAYVRQARQRLNAGARRQGDCMPIVQALEEKVSSFAMELLRSQTTRVTTLDIVEPISVALGPQFEGFFLVAKTTQPTPIDSHTMPHHDGDFGIAQVAFSRPRVTSWTSCSCQFNTSWGLPCRHMLRLYLDKRIRQLPDGVIKPFWYKLDDLSTQASRRALMLMPRPASLKSSTTSTKSMVSTQDRYLFLSMESKHILELGSMSDEALEIVLTCFEKAKTELTTLLGERVASTSSKHRQRVKNPITSLIAKRGRKQKRRIESSGKM